MSTVTRRPPGRPPKGTSDGGPDARDQLIQAAIELMVEQGTIDIPISQITGRAGLNVALVTYYFGGKSGLLVAILQKVLGQGVKQLAELAQEDMSPVEKLRMHISGMISVYFLYPFINPLIHHLVNSDPVQYGPTVAREFSQPTADIQRMILDEGRASGLFRDITPMHLYFHIVGACDQFFHGRYQMKTIFGIDKIDADLKRGYVHYLTDAILNGIVSRPT